MMDRAPPASIREIADALGVTARAIQKRAVAEAWPCEASGKARIYPLETLPDDVQIAVVAQRTREAEREAEAKAAAGTKNEKRIAAAWEAFTWSAGWRKKEAERRQAALVEVADLRRQGVSLTQARAQVAARMKREGMVGGSAHTLIRWSSAVAGVPRQKWLAFLMPDEKGRPELASIHPAAWAEFKLDWLRLEHPSGASGYRRVQRLAAVYPDWAPLPCVATFLARAEREIPRGVRILAREGEEAFILTGPSLTRDRSGLVAMQIVNSDGHKFDVAVRYPDGTIGRPMVVGWQDVFSGKLLSYRIGKSETAELVRLSFCDMVAKYGIPGRAELDNGRAFASKKITGGVPTRYRYKVLDEDPLGVITRLGVDVHWVQPYNGKAKPIERVWRDIAVDLAKRQEFAGAYLGNSPTTKPENYGSRAVPWADFVAVFADGVAEHNARSGRQSPVCNGRSLDQAFAASYAKTIVTIAGKAQLGMLLLASDVVTVNGQRGHVTLAGNRYWSEALCEHMGEKVELRFDPEALHGVVHVFRLDGTYIGEAPCNAAVGYLTSDGASNAMRTQKAYLKKFKELLKAEKERNAAAEPRPLPPIPDAELPPPGVIALHFPKRQAQPAPALAKDEEPDTEGAWSYDAWYEEQMARKRERDGL